MASLTSEYLTEEKYLDEVDKMMKFQQKKAQEVFQKYKQAILIEISRELSTIERELNKQMSIVCTKLAHKLRNNYSSVIQKMTMDFLLEPYVSPEYEKIKESIQLFRGKINQYVMQFSTQILQNNIKKSNSIGLFYITNNIKHTINEWYSVTSRLPLPRAEIIVTGLHRPETSWLALGVCKKMKEYGPVKKSINYEQFVGNIYLNGNESFYGNYSLQKNLNNNDKMVIENYNRMIFVYRKQQGRNMDEAFILDDNIDYYLYVAMKGPIQIEFLGE